MGRRRNNLIAFRTTEGSKLEEVHQQSLREGESIKEILESWAEQFNLSKHEGGERDER